MSDHRPLVSVTMVTYNQEPFIRESIRSVLDQTVSNLELVVVDDGSTDDTPQAVAEFDDPRVTYIRQANQGPGAAANAAIAACRGRYVAIMTGDDLSAPTRLADQLAAHERAGGGLVLSNVDYIDEDGRPLEDGHFPKDFFATPPMTRAEILRRFFESGNFLHLVSGFGELRLFRENGPFAPQLYQLQDFDWLIRLVKRHQFTFMPQQTIRWRIRRNAGNLSAATPFKSIRCINEHYLVMRTFFDDTPPEMIREAFASKFIKPDCATADELACELAFLYLRHPHFPFARLIGIERMYALLCAPPTAAILASRYGYGTLQYVEELGRNDIFNRFVGTQS